MADVLNIATTGLLAIQKALSTTGHNIANVNTEGYSRQRVDFATQKPQTLGGFSIGSGVAIADIDRISDELINQQLRNAYSTNDEMRTYFTQASQIDGILAEPGTSVSSALQNFYSALSESNDSPNYMPLRNSFISQSELLVSRFHALDSYFRDQQAQVNFQMSNTVGDINAIAEGIADINRQLLNSAGGGADLFDQRDNLLNELAKHVNVITYEQADGTVNVSVGNGQSLVVSDGALKLSAARSSSDPTQFDLFLNVNNNQIKITENIHGGSLGGLLKFQNEILTPAINSLGQMSLALADGFNQQHRLGMDLNGNLGGDFFSDFNATSQQLARVAADSNNTGTAQLALNITDVNQITSSNYLVSVTGGSNYSVTRLSDNTTTNYASLPQTIDGFTLSINSGAVAVGDSFLLTPTRNASQDLKLNINDPNQIALAAPIRTQAYTSNTGTAKITDGMVVDTSTSDFTTTPGQLTPPIRVEFLSSTSYQLVNASNAAVIEGPITYDPSVNNPIFPTPGAYDPGYRVSLSGAANTGDRFDIEYNTGGVSDNRNGLMLTGLQNRKLLNNGSSSTQDVYASLISDVGAKTHQSKINSEAAESLLGNAQSRRDGISGVNLDEEAALLLKYEQAYQAASRVITIANRMFSILFDSVGR